MLYSGLVRDALAIKKKKKRLAGGLNDIRVKNYCY